MGINPIQTQPLEGSNQLANLASLASTNDVYSQMALRQQQAKNAQTIDQQNQLGVQQTKLDMADQQKITQYMSDPANAAKLAAGDVSELYKMGVQAKNGQAVQTHFLDLHQKASTLKKTDLENGVTMGKEVSGGISGLMSLPENQRAAAYPGMLTSLAQKGIDISQLPKPGEVTDFSDAGLNQQAARMAIGQTVAEQGLAIQTKKADVGKTVAQTNEANAKALELQAAEAKSKVDALKVQQDTLWSQRQQTAGQLAAAAQKGPAQLEALRSSLTPEMQQYFAGASDPNAILDLGRTPEERVKSQQAAAELSRQAARDAQTAKHENEEAAVSRANANTNAAHLRIAQQTYEQTFGPNSDQQLVGVEKNARPAARAAMNEEAKRYQGTIRSADDLQTMVDLAKSGNKVAGTNIPLVTVGMVNAMNGIKRMNKAEIDAQAGAGNLWDQVVGKADKLVLGQPVPPEILKDTSALLQTMQAKGAQAHADRVTGINQTYHSAFKPIEIEHKAPPLPQGGGKVIDKATAATFYGAADNDPKKAQALAEANGWKVQ